MRIREGDTVAVMSGADRGKRGKVLRVLDGGDRVVVEGVNLLWKHRKKTPQSPKGGRVRREGSIHSSKVMPVDPESGRPTRVGHEVRDGRKVRVARRSGKPLAPPAAR